MPDLVSSTESVNFEDHVSIPHEARHPLPLLKWPLLTLAMGIAKARYWV